MSDQEATKAVTPVPNTAELVAIYQHIKNNPSDWNQQSWATRGFLCGTAYCFAGHAVARAGMTFDWEPDDYYGEAALFAAPHAGGEFRNIGWVASDLLGLTHDEADRLFHADNSLTDIRRIITRITGVDPETAQVAA